MDKKNINRILIARTDRIGDVILSTPFIQALRDKFPNAFISMMVRPYTEPIIRHNQFLDEVIVYDKYARHNRWYNTVSFAMALRKKKFDLAIALHPTNRVHIIFFLAGIRIRIGYDKKLKFLLTKCIHHTKQFGTKHELDYTLDILKTLNLSYIKYPLTLNVPGKTLDKIHDKINSLGWANNKIIAIQPGASCKSKIWPEDKYIQLIKELYDKFKASFVIIGDKDTKSISCAIKESLGFDIWDSVSELSILEVGGLLKFCKVLISNDSGPVHISSAVGTPVVAIFGRNQVGLSPRRWGPVGEKDIFLHKDVGCSSCLAHDCNQGFKCINAIKPEEVLDVLNQMQIL